MSDPGRMYLYAPQESGGERRQDSNGAAHRNGGGFTGRLLARARRAQPGGADAGEPAEEEGMERVHGSAEETWTSDAGNGGRGGSHGRWDAALGNVADASVTLQQLKHVIDDAVYLDEDAYNGVASLSHYNKTIQAQHRRIVELEHELEMALGGKEKAEARAIAETKRRKDAEERRDAVEAELENNAVVFKMHYNELLARNDEVEKLKAIIEGLSGA